MIAVFYDRKNKREVSSEQLVSINCVREIVVGDSDGYACRKIKPGQQLYLEKDLVAELGYKSEDCPDYANWNLYTTTKDLVFLRLEE